MSAVREATDTERPLAAYATLIATFGGLCAVFSAWFARSGRELPERIRADDLALVCIATHKVSRLITKDRVAAALRAPFTSFQADSGAGEVEEAARGRGLRRAIGELLTCPYCLAMWIGAVFLAAFAVAPRPTRLVASLMTVLTGSDVLQMAYKKAKDASRR